MDACRRLAHTIYTLDITLDESQFCSHCADDHDAPELGLLICYADRPKTHQIEGISLTDLIMIKAVIDGRLTYQEHEGTEYALRRETLRLKERRLLWLHPGQHLPFRHSQSGQEW